MRRASANPGFACEQNYAEIGGARGGGMRKQGVAWLARVSAGATHATMRNATGKAAGARPNAGMCATWQIWHVASEEPGASVCQNPAPMASSNTANAAPARPKL
jgi:hypothetical protein